MPPAPPPALQKQTLKAAKASFKSRGQPSLSEREAKQLQRSINLDRRAWAVKEREKRKLDLARKRAEKERREQEELRRVQMGTQRRKDRWGFKGSQMHLGAFFGGGGGGGGGALKREAVVKESQVEDDMIEQTVEDADEFGGEIDDEILLEALQSPEAKVKVRAGHSMSDIASEPHPPPQPVLRRSFAEPPRTAVDEFSDCWDELGSSTQIARELAADEKQSISAHALNKAAFMLSSSETVKVTDLKAQADRKAMPPPALPVARPPGQHSKLAKSCTTGESLQISLPSRNTSTRHDDIDSRLNTQTVVAEFSLDELESLVDDDLQLTQVAPG